MLDLPPAQYAELLQDLETLKTRYNYIVKELDETQKPHPPVSVLAACGVFQARAKEDPERSVNNAL